MTLALAGAAALLLAVAPLSRVRSCVTVLSDAGTVCMTEAKSLIEAEGAGMLGFLAVPVLLALVPFQWRSRRSHVATAWLLTIIAVVSLASIGLFFVPAAASAWMAARAPVGPTAPAQVSRSAEEVV